MVGTRLVHGLAHGCCMVGTWLAHGWHMVYTWLAHGWYMVGTWLNQNLTRNFYDPQIQQHQQYCCIADVIEDLRNFDMEAESSDYAY